MNNLEYTRADGQQITVNNVRVKVAELSFQIHAAKQEHIKNEKQSMEDKKTNQLQAKQNLKSETIPELYVLGTETTFVHG